MEPVDLPPLSLVPLPRRQDDRREDGTFKPGAGGKHPHFMDDSVRRKILTFIQAGANWSVAARAAGINRQRLHDWRKRANDGEEPYATFMAEVDQAEAECEVRLASSFAIAALTDYRAARDLLRVRFRERWDVGSPAELGVDAEELIEPRDDIEHMSEMLAAYEEAGIVPKQVVAEGE